MVKSIKKWILLGLLVILVGILFSVNFLGKKPASSAELLTHQAAFSIEGPFMVGTRTIEISDESPLELMVWYPGLVDTETNSISYSFEIKFQEPIGRIAIATYKGYVARDVAFDFSMAPYPLVILSPGFSISPTAYGWLAEHLASYGFVVISPNHLEILDPENDLWQAIIERPNDILTVFDYVDKQTGDGGLFENIIDPDLVAVAGHSYGGYTSLTAAGARVDIAQIENYCKLVNSQAESGAWLCSQLLPRLSDMALMAGIEPDGEKLFPSAADPRVDVVISMAGNALFFSEQSLSEVTVPVMAIGGTADDDAPYMWSTYPTYKYVSSEHKISVTLKGAEHMIFAGPCEKTPLYLAPFSKEFCSDSTWNRTNAHLLIKHFTTAFLLAEIKSDIAGIVQLSPGGVDFEDVSYEAVGYGD